MIKNEEYTGTVQGLGSDGEGIIYCEGAAVFVPFCLVGEEVKFKVLKVKGNIAYGKLIEVLKPSPERVNPPCPVFGKCGGCDLQHASYAAQLDFKRGLIKNCLLKIGGISAEVEKAVPCAEQYGYRNKISLPIGEEGAGLYARHSHRIVPTENCAIQKPWAERVIAAANGFVKSSEDKKLLRHLVVREIQGKFIFALVAEKQVDARPLIKSLERDFDEFTFLININDGSGNAIFGKVWRVVKGSGFFKAEEGGIKYTAGANTFLQVNDGVRAKLYAKVLEEAGENSVAIDLYSGGGMLTAMLAKKCKKAYGIEIVPEASRCADELKKENGLDGKMTNICGKVEEQIEKVISETAGEKRVIVCDPPRKGMERSVVYAIKNSGAEKVILISCNPATLARDLGVLCGTLEEKGGELIKSPSPDGVYEIESITPYDMFPQTKHVETLVVLSKVQKEGF
ncbi:MAG: 23S rRNA (uracil(1939)-C(5))-methyltransferase RlmD [Clostridia bacterium]|nr:23S rRNA (uracil(1939)-C(5))-methyltransferase RlmD [Clostridia bacterium]